MPEKESERQPEEDWVREPEDYYHRKRFGMLQNRVSPTLPLLLLVEIDDDQVTRIMIGQY